MIILDDNHVHHMRTAAEEVKARGAKVIIITDKPALARDLDPNPIVSSSTQRPNDRFGWEPFCLLQVIAYELATMQGINTDTTYSLDTPKLTRGYYFIHDVVTSSFPTRYCAMNVCTGTCVVALYDSFILLNSQF